MSDIDIDIPRVRARCGPGQHEQDRIIKRLGLSLLFFDQQHACELLRIALVEKRLEHEQAFSSRDETWGEAFERWYGDPLEVAP